MRFLKKINERGTMTLPLEVREALGIETGDMVEIQVVGIRKKATGEYIPVKMHLPDTPDERVEGVVA